MSLAPGAPRAAIELRDVFRVHSSPEGDAAALQGLSLAIAERELVAVLGPSGAGKSTLLRILAGVERASAGVVTVLGEEGPRDASRGDDDLRFALAQQHGIPSGRLVDRPGRLGVSEA